jgi:hypothetical protein
MNRFVFQQRDCLSLAVAVLLACGFAGAAAHASTEKTAAKPSTPTKPAAGAKPASSGAAHGAPTSAGHTGPTTGHAGPTTSGHSGPTTGSPRGGATTTGSHPMAGGRPTEQGRGNLGGSRPGAGNRTATDRTAPRGSRTVATRNGAVTRRANGRISDVHDAQHGMDIHHGLNGGRRVSVERADHSRLVAERGRRGFVERRYAFRGHDFARRSYYWHGQEYNRYYRGYYYHGAFVNVYAPAVFYPPAFYGWAYNPWAAPVAFGWGWAGTPWFGFYGAYFTPYPVYAGPAFWLTDYMIAADLQAAYAAINATANTPAAASAPQDLPATLNVCEQGGCGTMTWNGTQYSGTFNNGAVAILTVDRWDANSIVLSRTDPAGVSAGNTATYTGRVLTPNSIGGRVTGVYNGGAWTETWQATSPTPVLMASNADPPTGGGAPALTPDVKAEIVDEVKAEIALENSEAQQNTQGQDADPGSSGIARMLGDGHPHVFVAGDALDVVDSNGAECALSDGDVLQFSGPSPAADATDANLMVLASKGGNECQRAATVTVAVTDLQEMQNHLRETIDQGLQEMQAKQGQGGLPAAPASAKAPPVETAFAQSAPPPEQNGAADVNQELTQADQVDQQAAQDAPAAGATAPITPPPPPAPAQTVNIALGQTIDQVTTALGPPLTVVDLGAKKIYKYKDMKVTFKAGKVSDVE